MEKQEEKQELYHEETENLKRFKKKLDAYTVLKSDIEEFTDQYEELVAQAKVITRVSDRLQKKLDTANIQIRDQNEEIKDKNLELESTVVQLAQAKVGKRASAIMLIVALGLFVAEFFLEPLLEAKLNLVYARFGVLIIIFFVVKALESGLESYFMKKEKDKIMGEELKLKSEAQEESYD